MTNINEVIAPQRGWIKNPSKEQYCVPDGYPLSALPKWYHSDTKIILNSRDPDYQGDANLYMPLYFELPTDQRMQLATVKEDEFGEAVCLSWLKMKGIEI